MDLHPVKRIAECFDENDQSGRNGKSKKRFLGMKKVDLKIQSFAHELMPAKLERGQLSNVIHVAVPGILARLFQNYFLGKPKKRKNYLFEEKTTFLKKGRLSKSDYPIGIRNNGNSNWINALMQFIIFLPSLRNMFDFLPKSFEPFAHFIDLYLCDQQAKKSITMADSELLLECLFDKIPRKAFFTGGNNVDLFFVLRVMMEKINSPSKEGADLLALYPDRLVICENNLQKDVFLKERLAEKFAALPEFLFALYPVYIKDISGIIPKQFSILGKEGSAFYDLDAFIEFRPDQEKGSYVTYLKAKGSWWLCDDERVIAIRSNNLDLGLIQGFLFHYRKVDFQVGF